MKQAEIKDFAGLHRYIHAHTAAMGEPPSAIELPRAVVTCIKLDLNRDYGGKYLFPVNADIEAKLPMRVMGVLIVKGEK